MPHRDDPFAPEPEEPPTQDSGATEVEAERVERGNADEGLRTIEATDEPTLKGTNTQTWAVLAHLGPLILLLFGISMPLVFLVPLVLLHTVGVDDRNTAAVSTGHMPVTCYAAHRGVPVKYSMSSSVPRRHVLQ